MTAMTSTFARSAPPDLLSIGTRYAIRQAEGLLKLSGQSEPPYSITALAPLRKIKLIRRENLGNLSGMLLPLEDGFEVTLNAAQPPERQFFSLAHEISHTFFLDKEGRFFAESIAKAKGERTANKWIEFFCDIAASELLMPIDSFTKYASAHHFGIEAIEPLSRQFKVSLDAAAIRLSDLNTKKPSYVVHWEMDHSLVSAENRLRANWMTSPHKKLSPNTGKFTFKPIIDGDFTPVYEAFESQQPTFINQTLTIGKKSLKCKVYSQGFGPDSSRFAISMIFPEQYY